MCLVGWPVLGFGYVEEVRDEGSFDHDSAGDGV